MRKQIVNTFFSVLMIALLAGCAGGEGNRDNSRQGQTSMGKGQGGRGGGKGPPPMRDNSDGADEEPPAEAFAACVEKGIGDYVEFTNPQGETIKAVCEEYEDHLVAVPEKR